MDVLDVVYVALMGDEYPPFRLDAGPTHRSRTERQIMTITATTAPPTTQRTKGLWLIPTGLTPAAMDPHRLRLASSRS